MKLFYDSYVNSLSLPRKIIHYKQLFHIVIIFYKNINKHKKEA